ncbi:MAG: YbhB/YbcL family Raf kinase inhibitor-like protein [Pseudomonadota bacterium]
MFSQSFIRKGFPGNSAAILASLLLGISSNSALASTVTDGLNKPCIDQTTGDVRSGETRVCNSLEVHQFTRLSSSGRDRGAAGDQLYLQGAPAGLLVSAYTPILNQPAARLGDSHTLAQHMANALSEATGLGYYTMGQDHLATVTFIAGQTTMTFLPVGDIIVDTSRANGLRYLDDGRAEIAVNGLVVTLVSTAVPITDLMAKLVEMDPQARLELTPNGWMKATLGGIVYPLWPGFAANSLTGQSGGAKWEVKSDNLIHLTFPSPFQQVHVPAFSGMEQIIYPAFDDRDSLMETFRPYDAALRVGSRMDGSYTAIFQGNLHRLTPAYTVTFPVPAEHQRDLWWTQNGQYFFKNRDGSVQGFNLSPVPENTINMSSHAVGATIPATYSCLGANRSIPLIWSGAPQYTQSYAIIMDDPDAAGGTFVHWNVFNIRPWVNGVADGASGSFMPAGSEEGINDFGTSGYSGPCPPSTHRYTVKVFALKNLITSPSSPMTIREFEMAYGTDIIGSAFFDATFTP